MTHLSIRDLDLDLDQDLDHCETKSHRINNVCSIVVKYVKVLDGYRLFIAMHKKDNQTHGINVMPINPLVHDIRFHESFGQKHRQSDSVIPSESKISSLFQSLSLDSGSMRSTGSSGSSGSEFTQSMDSDSTHGYGTKALNLETEYGLEVIRDLISDNFNSTLRLDETNIWVHKLYVLAKDTGDQGLIFVPLSNIITLDPRGLGDPTDLSPCSIESLDHNGKKINCLIDPRTIGLIRHVHSLGHLVNQTMSGRWL
jgi:hypothetical protein